MMTENVASLMALFCELFIEAAKSTSYDHVVVHICALKIRTRKSFAGFSVKLQQEKSIEIKQ